MSRITHTFRQIILAGKPGIVDKTHTTQPIAVFWSRLCFHIVLPSDKVPHKVAEIHMPQLVIKKETQVITKGGLFPALSIHLYGFSISGILIIHALMFGFLGTPHSREDSSEAFIINRNCPLSFICDYIFSGLFIADILWARILIINSGCSIVLSMQFRPAAILFPVQV